MRRDSDLSDSMATFIVAAVLTGVFLALSAAITLVVGALMRTGSAVLWAALGIWAMVILGAVVTGSTTAIIAALIASGLLLVVAKVEDIRHDGDTRRKRSEDQPLILTDWWEDG